MRTWCQFGSKLRRRSWVSWTRGCRRFALRRGGEVGVHFFPCCFVPSYTCWMLYDALHCDLYTMTLYDLYSVLNFCSAAKSAPSVSWTLYLSFPSVQFSKHTLSTYCMQGRMESTGSLIYQCMLHIFITHKIYLYIIYVHIYESIFS